MRYVGVDGCKNGWVVVWLDEHDVGVRVYQHMKELWNDHMTARIILVDIPIGLVDEGDTYRSRECDQRARELLGRKSSSIFSAPSRSSLYEPDYKHASEKNFLITGKKLSKQSYYLIPKIKEVDEFLMQTPLAHSIIRESHPELCFHALTGFVDLNSKKTKVGQAQRIDCLRQYEPSIEPEHLFTVKAAVDDILDAYVLALTAKLAKLPSNLRSVCKKCQYDSIGRLMDIVFF